MKKKHPEHVNLERWLVSYADFITLLFAFFVVMYAMANQDKAKVKQITDAIERTFRGPSTMLDMGSGSSVSVFSNPSTDKGQVIDTTMGRTNARPDQDPELQKIASHIEESLAYQLQTTDLKDKLRILYDDRGLIIRFSASKIFAPGQVAVNKSFWPTLDKISDILKEGKRVIRVEGHTDNTPPPAGKFDTNWELSTARAAWIVRYLKARGEIPTARLSAAGFADGHPIANNNSEDGRAMNRRVEVVVTNLVVE
ncbi:MAG: OmpA family protein [Oligoflexia bacterium]|nr:OmpA family protein [Oligoflexia bacterium]